MVFSADGTLGLTADCNLFNGMYEVKKERLILMLGASTLAYCGEESPDNQYLQLLGSVTSYELTDEKLVLYLSEDAGKMVFADGDAAGAN